MHSSARVAVVMLLSLSGIPLLGQEPVSFSPGLLGRISGQVVDADTERPVPGARVTLSDYGPPKRQVVADANGRFAIEAAPAGLFELRTDLEGYRGSEFGQRRPGGSWQWFDLADGEQVTNVVLKMWRLASVSGVVLSETGEPVRGLVVQALKATALDGHAKFGVVGHPSVTDATGSYSLSNLVPGDFILAVGGSRYGGAFDRGASGRTPTTYFPSAIAPEDATVLTLHGGEDRRNVTVQLRTAAGHTVSGRLTDMPPAWPMMPLQLRPTDTAGRMAQLATLSTYVTSNGTFAFEGVPPGSYTVTAVAVPHAAHAAGMLSLTQELVTEGQTFGFPTSERGNAIAPAPVAPTFWASAPVIVGDADITGVEAAVQQGATIWGRVEFDASDDRPPIDQIRRTPLIVVESSRSDLGSFPAGAIDADGRFRMVNLPPGQYAIRLLPIVDGGLRGWTTASVRQGDRELSGAAFELGTTDIRDLVITLTTRLAKVAGVVRDDAGRAAPDAMLYVFPADRSRWGSLDMDEHWPRVMRPARSGKYQTDGLAPGDYVIAALTSDAPDPPRTTFDIVKIFQTGVPVTVSPNETHALDLVVRQWKQ